MRTIRRYSNRKLHDTQTSHFVTLAQKPMPNSDLNITALVEAFGRQLVTTMEASVAERIQAAIAGALGLPARPGPGRPARQSVASVVSVAATRKRRTRRLSQMPWFENPASPSFEMACIDFGDTAKPRAPKHRPSKVATPQVARARKLQGQYLGALKSLKGWKRAKVKAMVKEKGVAAAVKLALSLKRS
jgi:hypothetical protein